MKKIILASSSPRRRELLKRIGLRFTVAGSGYEEEMHPTRRPRSLARHLSREKARSVALRHRNALVIAADTFIAFEGKILGKPHTRKEAIQMLTSLNGKAHTVITGLTVIDADSGKTVSRSAATTVYFRKLTAGEIASYADTGEPLDKAGGYAIQGLGATLVRKIAGDFYNVVGLPLSLLVECLKEFGVEVLRKTR